MASESPALLIPQVFGPQIIAAFTTRRGGVSREPYESLNLGLSTGDNPEAVTTNRQIVLRTLGVPVDSVALTGQVHGTVVRRVTSGGLVKETDGLVTSVPGLTLAVTAADCAVVLLADEAAGIVGACHAGWRGAVGGIVPNTIALMVAAGADSARMRAYISPCICAEHFEVGEEVASRFPESVVIRGGGVSKPHVDLKKYLQEVLETAGLDQAMIEVDPGCTVSQRESFYSHRGENGVTGRMMGFIALPHRERRRS